jgi:hypothetical protein
MVSELDTVQPYRNDKCRYYYSCLSECAYKNTILDCTDCEYRCDVNGEVEEETDFRAYWRLLRQIFYPKR